jgi:hypothetical protein
MIHLWSAGSASTTIVLETTGMSKSLWEFVDEDEDLKRRGAEGAVSGTGPGSVHLSRWQAHSFFSQRPPRRCVSNPLRLFSKWLAAADTFPENWYTIMLFGQSG